MICILKSNVGLLVIKLCDGFKSFLLISPSTYYLFSILKVTILCGFVSIIVLSFRRRLILVFCSFKLLEISPLSVALDYLLKGLPYFFNLTLIFYIYLSEICPFVTWFKSFLHFCYLGEILAICGEFYNISISDLDLAWRTIYGGFL